MKKHMIKLIIKALNEPVKDQMIVCNLNWTIGQLKDHLSNVYPNNPKTGNQRLSYCGQFLDNSLDLKNIFPISENSEQVFTLHLMCKENLSNIMRHVGNTYFYKAGQSEYYQVLRLSEKCHSIYDITMLMQEFSFVYTQLSERQITWIQLTYQHYLKHYFQLLSTNSLQFYKMYWRFQLLGITANNVNNNIVLSYLLNNQDEYQQTVLSHAEVLTYNNNNNIVNYNNQNNINNNNDGEDIAVVNNRDWLDNFYTLSRIIILFSIVYFYSSPIRFIIVAFLGFLIYLYHKGFFRGHEVAVVDNNNGRMYNNNQAPQNANRTPVVQRALENQRINRREFSFPIYQNNENEEARLGALSYTWIFFSSFFASLVPDQPNLA